MRNRVVHNISFEIEVSDFIEECIEKTGSTRSGFVNLVMKKMMCGELVEVI